MFSSYLTYLFQTSFSVIFLLNEYTGASYENTGVKSNIYKNFSMEFKKITLLKSLSRANPAVKLSFCEFQMILIILSFYRIYLVVRTVHFKE